MVGHDDDDVVSKCDEVSTSATANAEGGGESRVA